MIREFQGYRLSRSSNSSVSLDICFILVSVYHFLGIPISFHYSLCAPRSLCNTPRIPCVFRAKSFFVSLFTHDLLLSLTVFPFAIPYILVTRLENCNRVYRVNCAVFTNTTKHPPLISIQLSEGHCGDSKASSRTPQRVRTCGASAILAKTSSGREKKFA